MVAMTGFLQALSRVLLTCNESRVVHVAACVCVCVTGRFNERLVLSLASCPHCLLMDDELNVLPTSTLIR